MLRFLVTICLLLAFANKFTNCDLVVDHIQELNPYTSSLKSKFEQSFKEKCSKYPFVKQWEQSLENTGDRYVTFMYHEPGLKNGGLGDRIAGLLNAMAIALRTNRTLLIESQNGIHDLFQPFHSDLLQVSSPHKYTWRKQNWTDWSHYNKRLANNDNTEYDLYFCINNVAWRNKICGMDDGDVPQPHIKLRGNRAFFCKWATHPELVASKEFFHVIAPIGVKSYEAINLMEVAGCMTRLALWPTELLWQFVSDSLEAHMGHESVKRHSKLQVGTHFRCGDLSYTKGQDNWCIHDTDGSNPHEESTYMGAGNPAQIGQCAADLARMYSNRFVETRLSDALIGNILSSRLLSQPRGYHNKTRHLLRHRKLISQALEKTLNTVDNNEKHEDEEEKKEILLYIASDNVGSAQQINSTANLPLTMISPKGCHVEMDPSFDCQKTTIGFWLILAASDVIVTQTDLTGSPISAFSRYAALYGLKGDSLRDARDCSNVKPLYTIGRKWTGNWFCD